MADRGLHAYVVPSTRAGQQTDPAARRAALSGLLTGGFLLAVIVAVLTIVIAAPKYAEPAVAADPSSPADSALGADAADVDADDPADLGAATVTPSKSPAKLKGYRWPVRGGMIDTFYDYDPKGRFEVEGKRVHDGIVITWFEGAVVKAAHKGTVVAAGRDWVRHVGYDGSLDDFFVRLESQQAKDKKKGRTIKQYPLGVVIDDGNGYYSVYTELKNLKVKRNDVVKAGQPIGEMTSAEGKIMMRYRLVRLDGVMMMKVHESDREKGYPGYALERVDPLAVLNTEAKRMPKRVDKAPKNPPRLSEDY